MAARTMGSRQWLAIQNASRAYQWNHAPPSSKPPRTHTSRSRLKINDGSVGSGPHGARFCPRRTPSPWSSVTTSPSTVCSRLRSCADWRFRKPDLGTWRPVISAFRQRFGRASPCLRAGATSLSLTNEQPAEHGTGVRLVLDPESAHPSTAIFVAEDHLGAREVLFAPSSESPTVKGRPIEEHHNT